MKTTEITITYDLIEVIKTRPNNVLSWEHIKFIMERITNDIKSLPTIHPAPYHLNHAPLIPSRSLGHIVNIDNQDIFLEIYFDALVEGGALIENSYIVDHYEVISSDRFLDLMLEGRRIELSDEPVRQME
tara:strand:+ start:738 stop:1127 length:390 start_codon:yes stop_codon:yes gene_type:complete